MTNELRQIRGGVCAPQGFSANGIHCGIRHDESRKDLSLVASSVPASAAAVYTRNLVKGAPIIVTREHLENGRAQAVIANSGNANTSNADGIQKARAMCRLAGEALGIPEEDIIVASTGVIGKPLDIRPIETSMGELLKGLSKDGGRRAAEGIMTTDTYPKEVAVEFELQGKTCRIGAMGKGSGMIHPDMATMLVFVTTDVAVSSKMLELGLREDVAKSFNMLSVDGDTSTNDTVAVMANGLAGNTLIEAPGEEFGIFMRALNTVTVRMCRMLAGDGEGATKLLECRVSGAPSEEAAGKAAKSVISSSLVKAAMFGADANWGRVLCAIGYSGADIAVDRVDIAFVSGKGRVVVCEHGAGVEFSEEQAKAVLLEDEITIEVSLDQGSYEALAWGCDLSYDYVRINGDYRT